MWQYSFKKLFKFHNFIQIFYCGTTRLRNTSLSVFIQCQYTRTILRIRNMGPSLFKKHSKIQNFDEIFYCAIPRLPNTNFEYSTTFFTVIWSNVAQIIGSSYNMYLLKNYAVGKITMRQDRFRKCSRCHRFSEPFQCVINRRMNSNSCTFC